MYESPIKAFAKSVSDSYEDGVVRIVQQYGFDVNKEELAKALAYDRGQYELGYKDGKDDAVRHAHWITTKYGRYCSHCEENIDPDDNADAFRFSYCPWCGYKMDEEVQE